MRKYILLILAPVIIGLPKLLDIIGIAGASDDLSTWGQWITGVGISNFLAFALFVFGVVIAFWEWRDRQRLTPLRWAKGKFLSSIGNNRFSKIRYYDSELVIQYLIKKWAAVPNGEVMSKSDMILADGRMTIEGLRLKGVYQRRRPLSINSCYVQSHTTGRKLAASVNEIEDFESVTVEGGAELTFRANLSGATIAEFRAEWMGFDFVIETKKFTKSISFPQSLLEWQLYDIVTQLNWKKAKELGTKQDVMKIVPKSKAGAT